LALFPHPGAKPREKVRARFGSFPGIQQLHGGLQLPKLALAVAALDNMRLNLGRHSMGIEQQIGQLIIRHLAIRVCVFHGLPPHSLPVGSGLFPLFHQTNSFNFSRNVW
jgi:hypothetical protein